MDQDEHKRKNLFSRFDGQVKKVIPNFNARAILYFTLIFAIAVYLQIWRIGMHPKPPASSKQETVIADDAYWQSAAYQERIKSQTVNSFTNELRSWLQGASQEFSRRKFEDILYINPALTPDTGGSLATVVPANFNYLENLGKARYQYVKAKGFLAEKPALVSLGQLVCDLDEKTEKATGIEFYDWRYASMPKLASFMASSPDWKMQVGDKIFDVSDPRIEDKDILKFRNSETQPAGLFSFLIFHDPVTNHIFLADSTILENNGIDSRLTLGRITSHWDKMPKLYFKAGFEGCKQINSEPIIDYGHAD